MWERINSGVRIYAMHETSVAYEDFGCSLLCRKPASHAESNPCVAFGAPSSLISAHIWHFKRSAWHFKLGTWSELGAWHSLAQRMAF